MSALFGSGKVGDLVQVATFLLQLDDIFWQLLHNGRRPVFRRVRKSVAAMRTASRTGSQAHEEVTRETYSLLKLIEEAPAWVA